MLERVCVEIPDSVKERSADGDPKPFVWDEPGLCDDSLSVFVGETDVLTVTVVVTITLDDTTPEFELVALIVGNVAVADTETLVNSEKLGDGEALIDACSNVAVTITEILCIPELLIDNKPLDEMILNDETESKGLTEEDTVIVCNALLETKLPLGEMVFDVETEREGSTEEDSKTVFTALLENKFPLEVTVLDVRELIVTVFDEETEADPDTVFSSLLVTIFDVEEMID